MSNSLSKEEMSEWILMHKKHQNLLEQLIPIAPDSALGGSYVSRLVKHNYPETIETLGFRSLWHDFPAMMSFLSDSADYEFHLEHQNAGHVGTLLFSMFKESGKGGVVTYDFKDLPIPYGFRAVVAADLHNLEKLDYRFGEQAEYTLYRRNFIDLKLAQEVARQYLKEGTRSDKVLWDEFLW